MDITKPTIKDSKNAEEDSDQESDSEDSDDEEDQKGEDEDYDEDEEVDEEDDETHDKFPIHGSLMDFHRMAILPDKLNWNNAAEIWHRYPDLDKPSDRDGKNILHLLIESHVNSSNSSKSTIRKAITEIVARYPELVQKRDDLEFNNTRVVGQTPLLSALASDDTRLVEIVVKSCVARPGDDGSDKKSKKSKKNDPLSQAIAVRCIIGGRTENALHYALRKWSAVVNINTPKKRAKINTLKKIVNKAPESAVASADSDGFTPLHYAVAYEHSSEDQYKIVKSLLKKGDTEKLIHKNKAALDFETKNEKLSVYQYLVKTRERFKEKRPMSKPSKNDGSRSAAVEQGKGDREHDPRALKKEPEKHKLWADKDRRDMNKDTTDEKKKDGPGQRDKDGPTPQSATRDSKEGPGPRQGRDLRGSVIKDGKDIRNIEDTKSAISNSKLKRTPTINSEQQSAIPEETAEDHKRERDRWADKVEMELKMQYLRKRSHQRATSLLYGKNLQHIQICFEYQGLPRKIEADFFTTCFRNVKFDTVLKYVAFPAVHVLEKGSKLMRSDDGRGRSDLLFFFQWLYKEKGVKRILKVIVEDGGGLPHSDDLPHSDEAIEKALRPFGVEHLDWSKPDLDPETIFNASKELTEIVLHWSGNNAVLRSWSEPEGLRRLPKLTTVQLIVDNTLESHDRTKINIDSFKERLRIPYQEYIPLTMPAIPAASSTQKTQLPRVGTGLIVTTEIPEGKSQPQPPELLLSESRPSMSEIAAQLKNFKPIVVKGSLDDYSPFHKDAPGGQSASGAQDSSARASHRWLAATDAFAQRISNVWDKIVKERTKAQSATAGGETAKSVSRDIIVALIDDGVDTTQDELVDRVLPGLTFSFDNDRVRPWHASERGHGTVMAHMICRVCPMIKIYPIRLKMDQRGKIDPQSAVDAINAAVDRGVDIISMSWTVGQPQGKLQTDFDNALQRAISEDVLMFCSSKDSGHVDDQYYPARYRSDSVIKVGAANQAGLPDEWTGSLDRLDFILPGVGVVKSHPNPPKGVEKMSVENTGSSVATALGAGLAGLIIYCAQIGQMYGKLGLTENDISRLRQRDTMVAAIRAFGGSSSTGGKFIEVWKKLEGRTRELARSSTSDARDKIAVLARDLVPTPT